jgi:hypothetical protein
MPQPGTDHEALITIHRARTEARSMPLSLRAYSHCWLVDHGVPSGLPDELKPRAERMYPRIVEAVGIAVKAGSAERIPLARRLRKAMEDAVAECYADGDTEPAFVRGRIVEARKKVFAEM